MKKVLLRLFAAGFFALCVLGAGALPGYAAAPQQSTPAKAQQAAKTPATPQMSLAPVAQEIGQQIQALVTGDEKTEIEPQETFGTRVLGLVLSFFSVVRNDGAAFVTNFAAIPQLVDWFGEQMNDPALNSRWQQTGQLLLLVLGTAFLAGWLTEFLFLPLRRRIRKLEPSSFGARFGALSGWLFLSLVPVVIFIAAALAVLSQNDPSKYVRIFVMSVVYAVALLRLVRLVVRFLMAAHSPALRLLPLSSVHALYLQKWLYAYSAVMILGYFGVDLARFVRMPAEAIAAINSLVGLTIVMMTIAVIVQKRAFVSAFLRGDLSAARHGLTLWQSLRLWLARSWHILAITYLVIGYIVTMLGAKGGFVIMQRGTILTLFMLLAMRMAFYGIGRLQPRRHGKDTPVTAGLFRPVVQIMLRLAAWVIGVGAIAAAWGMDIEGVVYSPWGQRIFGSVFTISSTILLVVLAYEMLHIAIERRLRPHDEEGQLVEANARARTLLPLVRNAAMIILAIIASLVTLSELGIDTTPLLAGAGILGVALGFGSQTLVKDFLTGLFIILEDTIAVGDVIQIDNHSGFVESITIRTVRLRDWDGSLHIVPFSAIAGFVNMTKGFSYALMTIGVTYDSNIPRVLDALRAEADAMQNDPAFRPFILEPVEIFGVDALADYSINVACRIKTVPGKQWVVKRAFLQRIKKRFDDEGIEIPFPTTTTYRIEASEKKPEEKANPGKPGNG